MVCFHIYIFTSHQYVISNKDFTPDLQIFFTDIPAEDDDEYQDHNMVDVDNRDDNNANFCDVDDH